MISNSTPFRAFVLVCCTAIPLLAQSASDDEVTKAKLLAEKLHQAALQHVTTDATKASLELMARKRLAEATAQVVLRSGGDSGRLVKDKPYSAEAVTETVQTLAGGNSIIRHNVSKLYRDASGRTRREQTIESLGPSSPVAPATNMIVISDPVSRIDYILDAELKTARKFGRYESAPLQQPPQGESLGSRMIEGLLCTGTKKTVTIPAGKIGNVLPIVVVTESWYAPAIEAFVRSTTSDPRFGETSYVLRNVVLAEPPPELFKLPSDYRVESSAKTTVKP
jgi:hypothetical protein